MGMKMISGGFLTTVQDLGRYGYQETGMAVSGVMDTRAAVLANLLVGNDEKEAVLEITIMGPAIEFDEDEVIALTGGDLGAVLDDQPVPRYQAVRVRPGQVLKFTGMNGGSRAYLAFAGGLDIPEVMGSKSTNLKSQIGGFEGRKLAAGDEIGFVAPDYWVPNIQARKLPAPNYSSRTHTLRVTLGPQDDHFKQRGIDTFFNNTYTVTNECDRMGCRLEGPAIAHKDGGDIITDGISLGAIQVPSHGNPIIMMADHQTTGGYAKIANVISVDLPILAQVMPGDKIRFKWATVGEAQMLYRQELQEFEALKEKWSAPDEKPFEPKMIRVASEEALQAAVDAGVFEEGDDKFVVSGFEMSLGEASVQETMLGGVSVPTRIYVECANRSALNEEMKAIVLAAAADAHKEYWNREGSYNVKVNGQKFQVRVAR